MRLNSELFETNLVLLIGGDVVDVHFVLGVESGQGGRQQLRSVQVVDDEVESVMDARPESVQQMLVVRQIFRGDVLKTRQQLGNLRMSPQMPNKLNAHVLVTVQRCTLCTIDLLDNDSRRDVLLLLGQVPRFSQQNDFGL